MVRSIAQIVPYKICEKIPNPWGDTNAYQIFIKLHHPNKSCPVINSAEFALRANNCKVFYVLSYFNLFNLKYDILNLDSQNIELWIHKDPDSETKSTQQVASRHITTQVWRLLPFDNSCFSRVLYYIEYTKRYYLKLNLLIITPHRQILHKK